MNRMLIGGVLCRLCGVGVLPADQAPAPAPEGSFDTKSLLYTNRGLEYWCANERGGKERLSGPSASETGCVNSKCHVETCDVGHKKEATGKAAYSVAAARSETACQKRHPQSPEDLQAD